MASSDVNILVKLTEGKNPLYFFRGDMSVARLGDFRTPRRDSGLLSNDVST
jgi:hypothetical protein